jgi:hypothetical protein
MIFICPKCGFQIQTSREKHVNSCNGLGPRRKRIKNGYNPWNKGLTKETDPILKKMSEDYIEKISSGKIIPIWIGKKHKPETIEKLKKGKILE